MAVVSQRGGDVGRPGQAQRADGSLAAGHGAGSVAGADLGGVLGKVTSRTQGSWFSIAQCPRT